MRRQGIRPRPHHRPGKTRGQRRRPNPRGALQKGIRHPPLRRHALPTQGRAARRRRRRKNPHQSRKLRRRPKGLRGQGVRKRGRLRQGTRIPHRGHVAPRDQMQGAQSLHAHRYQSREFEQSRPELLRGHSPRYGGERHRIRRHLPLAGLSQLRLLHEGVQSLGDGAELPTAGERDVPSGLGLSPPSRRDRGRRGRGRTYEERGGHRHPPRRRSRRYRPRVSHGGSGVRIRAVQSSLGNGRGTIGRDESRRRGAPVGREVVRRHPRHYQLLPSRGHPPHEERFR
mmetsp:Transcript_38243/g.80470  ORF Transcript_38243/g.80470 Transcript_38243/m.80470 type:complete len:284 (-) Transcript_38243:1824-2675(-)